MRVFARFVDAADIRMVELGRGLRFSQQTPMGARIGSIPAHALDGDPTTEPGIFRQEYVAHPAGSNQPEDAVLSNLLSGHRAL